MVNTIVLANLLDSMGNITRAASSGVWTALITQKDHSVDSTVDTIKPDLSKDWMVIIIRRVRFVVSMDNIISRVRFADLMAGIISEDPSRVSMAATIPRVLLWG